MLLLKAHESLLRQPLYRLLPFQLLDAQRIFRIYIVYYQGKAIELAVTCLDFHQDSHALAQRGTGHRLEIRSYEPVLRRPDYGIRLCHKPVSVALRKLHITMASATRLDCAHFGPDPDP